MAMATVMARSWTAAASWCEPTAPPRRTSGRSIAAVERASGRRVRMVLSDIEPEEGVAIQLFLFESQSDGR